MSFEGLSRRTYRRWCWEELESNNTSDGRSISFLFSSLISSFLNSFILEVLETSQKRQVTKSAAKSEGT
jgi:hypothetical protein